LIAFPAGAVVTNVSIVSQGEPLPGATLQIVDPEGHVVAEEETDEHGTLVLDLPEGEGYRLRTPEGELVGEPFAAGATVVVPAPAHLMPGTASLAHGKPDSHFPELDPDDPRLAEVPEETRKGNSRLGEATPWPRMSAAVGHSLVVADCSPELVAQPLAIGTAEGFSAAGLLKGFGSSVFSTGISLLSGGAVSVGGRSKRNQPKMSRDVVKRRTKSKISHPENHTKMRIGSKIEEDQVTLSMYLDKAKGKGTIHAAYFETDDCVRYWPEAYLAYALWGEWNLSVSFTATETRETYQDGHLVDRSSSSTGGGWSTGWQRWPGSFSEMVEITDPEALAALTDYQVAILEEMGVPAWRHAGFSAPMSGPRSMGAVFPAAPGMLQAMQEGRLRAVVHVTRQVDGMFQTAALPLRVTPGEKGPAFAVLDGAYPTLN
jgi:hypothetical protein